MRALVALAAAAVCKIVRRVNELAMSPPPFVGPALPAASHPRNHRTRRVYRSDRKKHLLFCRTMSLPCLYPGRFADAFCR